MSLLIKVARIILHLIKCHASSTLIVYVRGAQIPARGPNLAHLSKLSGPPDLLQFSQVYVILQMFECIILVWACPFSCCIIISVLNVYHDQYRINHTANPAYAGGPALLGGPALSDCPKCSKLLDFHSSVRYRLGLA